MLLEQRNMLMRIRMEDPESRKYELHNTGFDLDLIERKLKPKQQDRYDRNAKKREFSDYARGQRESQNCCGCFQNFSGELRQAVVYESPHLCVVYPMSTRPLHAEGFEANGHVQITPKEHFVSSLELDEDAFRELTSMKKTIRRYF